MLKIGLVVTPGFPIMSLAALSVFEFANVDAEKQLYDVKVLSEHGGPVATAMGVNVDTIAFGETHYDTVILGGNTQVVPTSPALREFVKSAARTTRRMSSICTGVFALADAGLLAQRRVTTHWLFIDELKQRLPDVDVIENVLFSVDGNVWTAAGNSAGVDLALRMLETDYGTERALSVARIMVIDYRRAGHHPQSSALLELNPKSDRIQDALAHARRNLRARLSVEDLAEVARLGPRQFSRAFRAETGVSPAKAVESLRLEAARLIIEQSQHPVDVVAEETGFGDEERMRRAFVRTFGHSPQALRRLARNRAEE